MPNKQRNNCACLTKIKTEMQKKQQKRKKNAWEAVGLKFTLLKLVVCNVSHSSYRKLCIQKIFRSLKNKNYIMSNSPSSVLISAK